MGLGVGNEILGRSGAPAEIGAGGAADSQLPRAST